MNELLNIYDENLKEAGIIQRSEVHSKGLLHQVVHCWLYEVKDDVIWIYLQQRSFDKTNFPGWFDIAAAGHINVNEDKSAAVKREILEELGIDINIENKDFFGTFPEHFRFNGLDDNELCQVYLYQIKSPDFSPGEEVESIVKVKLSKFKIWYEQEAEELIVYSVKDGSEIFINKNLFVSHDWKYVISVIEYLSNMDL